MYTKCHVHVVSRAHHLQMLETTCSAYVLSGFRYSGISCSCGLVFVMHSTNPNALPNPYYSTLSHRSPLVQARLKLAFQEKHEGREVEPSDGYDKSDLLFSNGGDVAIHMPYQWLFANGEAGAIKASMGPTPAQREAHNAVS